MAIFTFREEKYNSVILNKVSSEGHRLQIDKDLIVPAPVGTPTDKPIAIKVEGKYYLLQGYIDTKHNKPTLLCITKHTLKKCKVEPPVKQNEQNKSFQESWNNSYYSNRSNDLYSGRRASSY